MTRCDRCQHDWQEELNQTVIWLDEEGEETQELMICDDCMWDEYIIVRRKLDIGAPQEKEAEWKAKVKAIREKRKRESA